MENVNDIYPFVPEPSENFSNSARGKIAVFFFDEFETFIDMMQICHVLYHQWSFYVSNGIFMNKSIEKFVDT